MITTPLVALLAMLPGFQEPVKYVDPSLGIQFDRTSQWVEQKKAKDGSRFLVPLPDSSEQALFEVLRAPFHSGKDIWQTIQVDITKATKKTLVRQWEQDILAVPMLFTQVTWNDKGVDKTTLSGLFYTRTPVKMLIKVTTPTSEFPKAQYLLDQVLQSMSTLDGAVPQEDDPEVKLAPAPQKPVAAPKKPRVISAEREVVKESGARVEFPLTVSTKQLKLSTPEGWRVENSDDGRITLRHADLENPLVIDVRYLLDSDPPLKALFVQSTQTLNDYNAVTKREDTDGQINRTGCKISSIYRLGKGNQGDLATFEAMGLQGDFYFLFSYRSTKSATAAAERKVIQSLLDGISLEASAQ